MPKITLSGETIQFNSERENTIDSIILHGKTTQSGTGDPSPTNIRPIYGVGQFDKKIIFDGSADEAWELIGTGDTAFFIIFALSSSRTTVITSDFPYAPINYSNTVQGAGNWDSEFYLRWSALFTTVTELRAYLAAHPLTVYYQSTAYPTATQVYIGFSVTDANGYHGYAAGPMARLFEGDTIDFVSGSVVRTQGNISSYNGELLTSTWISDRDVYAVGTAPTVGAHVVYQLATPTTETVPISEPITNAAGVVKVFSESGTNLTLTYTQFEVLNNKYQDLHLTDYQIYSQFMQYWQNNQFREALALIDNNPQINTSSLISTVINTLNENLTKLQNMNDPTFKADKIQVSRTPPVGLKTGQVYFKI